MQSQMSIPFLEYIPIIHEIMQKSSALKANRNYVRYKLPIIIETLYGYTAMTQNQMFPSKTLGIIFLFCFYLIGFKQV